MDDTVPQWSSKPCFRAIDRSDGNVRSNVSEFEVMCSMNIKSRGFTIVVFGRLQLDGEQSFQRVDITFHCLLPQDLRGEWSGRECEDVRMEHLLQLSQAMFQDDDIQLYAADTRTILLHASDLHMPVEAQLEDGRCLPVFLACGERDLEGS